jgi:hypothetical protein
VISFSVPKAGDFIDAHAAKATGEMANRTRIRKEQSFVLNGFSGDRMQNALTVYYDEMIQNLVDALCANFSDARRLPRLEQPVPVVLSGGTAMPSGFLARFEQRLRSADFPFAISEIRLSADPLNSTAKGALLAAMC